MFTQHDAGVPLFAQLPPELVLYIFILTAESSTSSALDLCRVSRVVHANVRPIVFRTVVLSTTSKTDQFLRTLRSGDEAFFAQHVKNLFIVDGLFEHMFRSTQAVVNAIWKIIATCTGLERIVAPVVWLARLERASTREGLPCAALRHIVLTRTRYLQVEPNFARPLFRDLTRLFIQSHYYVWLPDAMVVQRDTFPALSHLAVLHIQFRDPVNAQQSDSTLLRRLPSALALPALRRLMICNSCAPDAVLASDAFIRSLGNFKDTRIRVVFGYNSSSDILPDFREGDDWWDAGTEVYHVP